MTDRPSTPAPQGSLIAADGETAPAASSPGHGRQPAWRASLDRLLVPVAGSALVALFSSAPYEGVALAFLAFVCAGLFVPPSPPWVAQLRFARLPLMALRPVAAVAAITVVQLITGLPGLTVLEGLVLLLVTSAVAAFGRAPTSYAWLPDRQIRTAVLGSPRSAVELARELAVAGIDGYVVIGRIDVGERSWGDHPEAPNLGRLEDLRTLVEQHGIDLLILTAEVPRFAVFEQVASSCLHLPVRLWELSGFYEDVFGHVPVAEINAAWFQYIMHPRYRALAPGSKRVLDVLLAGLLLIATLPLMLLFMLLIRRDGGSVLFRQTRIGEGGRPLTVYKLRTMSDDTSAAVRWATPDDPRVTRVGRLLRRTHLDELPQLVNVLRGDMTLVGPRPEQPEFVDRLEEALPFYQRRHLIKPGVTGWAQVRCGYAGSDEGSAWKLCHDLYYLKHRSLGFDLAILAETLRTLVADRYNAVEASRVSFIHGRDELKPELELAAG